MSYLFNIDVGVKSPFQRRKPKNTILLKKQVKFTDDLQPSQVLPVEAETKLDDPKAQNIEGLMQGLFIRFN